jgi:hypothetical protein
MGYRTTILVSIGTINYYVISEDILLEIVEVVRNLTGSIEYSSKYFTSLFLSEIAGYKLSSEMKSCLQETRLFPNIVFYFFKLGEELDDNTYIIINNGRYINLKLKFKSNISEYDSKYIIFDYSSYGSACVELEFDSNEYNLDVWEERRNFMYTKMKELNSVNIFSKLK